MYINNNNSILFCKMVHIPIILVGQSHKNNKQSKYKCNNLSKSGKYMYYY